MPCFILVEMNGGAYAPCHREDISLYIRQLFTKNLSRYCFFSLLGKAYGFISCECLCISHSKEIK